MYQFYCPPFAFGTIMPMTFIRYRRTGLILILWVLIFLLPAGCASTPGPAAVPASQTAPVFQSTLTPFQPGPATIVDPYAATQTPPPLPTYTPFPSRFVAAEGLAPKVDLLPRTDAGRAPINNPLTGLPISDPSTFQHRPFAVKIANSPDYIRPQSGLSLADVAYEYYIEWGDTRFIAVFYSNNPVMIGPVRSGRYFDEHITRMYHAFLVFKSADPRELSYLKESDLKDFLVIVGFGGCSPYFTGPYQRDSYNNQFFDSTKWGECAAKKGVDNSPQTINGGFFAEEPPQSPLSAARIYSSYSDYSYNYWSYEPTARQYFRFQEANDLVDGGKEAYTPLSDAQTGLPVTAENVVVLLIPHIYANSYNAADQVFNIDLLDYGNAYVFRDGLAIPAIWHRTLPDQPLLLTHLNGDPVFLRPGKTFYQVMGLNSTLTQDGTDWRFVFKTP